jgi:predicted RNase H-like HicB family nuclease
MILDVVVKKSDDGFTAEVPSINGCESWAHDEETVLNKIVELASFYLNTNKEKFKLDKARVKSNTSVYKLVFDKASG